MQKLFAISWLLLFTAMTAFGQNDLSLGVSTASGTVAIGDNVTFTVTVNNQGATSVTGVEVTNLLPPGMSYVSHSASAGSYTSGTGVWNIGNIGAGTSSVTLNVVVNITGEGVQLLQSHITAMNEYDGDSAPSNSSVLEDDFGAACVTVPIQYCTGTTIDVTASAPAGYSSYQWYKNGSPIGGATSQTYNILEVGEFTYQVNGGSVGVCTNGNCCPLIVEFITSPTAGITNNAPGGTTVVTCATPTISLTATGGSSYAWSGGLGNLAAADVIAPGTYTVTVTSGNACTATASITITEDKTPPTAGITNNAPGSTTELTCTVTSIPVTATGGDSYAWSAGLGNSANATITDPGTYTVTVTGTNGCTSTANITITEDVTTPTSGIVNNAPGGTTVLTCTTPSIALQAIGGVSYAWSGGLGNTANVNVVDPGTYSVTVTGTNGCTATAEMTITEDKIPPTAAITNTTPGGTTELTCNTPTITLTATGGTFYNWSAGLGNTASVSVTDPGTYAVTVTGDNGCTSTANITITEDITPPTAGITSNAPGGSTVITCLQTSIPVTASGGVSYAWSNGLGNTASVSISTAGTYTVTVTGTNGCTSTADVTITGACTVDYGDLPDASVGGSYATTSADNGPSHGIVVGLSLGNAADADPDGQPSTNADGDDNDTDGDDDEGLTVGNTIDIVPGGTIRLPLDVTNTTGDTAFVVIYIDWNGDGDFTDPGEQVTNLNDGTTPFPDFVTITVPAGVNTTVPIGVIIRLSLENNVGSEGYVSSGEVESLLINASCPPQICLPVSSVRN